MSLRVHEIGLISIGWIRLHVIVTQMRRTARNCVMLKVNKWVNFVLPTQVVTWIVHPT